MFLQNELWIFLHHVELLPVDVTAIAQKDLLIVADELSGGRVIVKTVGSAHTEIKKRDLKEKYGQK